MNSTHHRSDRLVLGRSPQDEAVEELAEEQGWQRVEEVTEDGARQILWAVGPGTSLTYAEDPVSHNAYAVLVSEDKETFEETLDVVLDELMPWQPRALLSSIEQAEDALARARAVIRAGLGAPDRYDEHFFTRIREAFESSDRWVREAAVWATAYSPWPQYRPLLEATVRNDPEEKLRADAASILAGFDAQGVQGP
ncbi:HEAT repeat domain-containing protein [Streptomyces sp. NPDC047043]|uniref:HEAT repeat domain-containing protein n=1 Tax=Streptomyces sp. NPDC047043 TaxID=3154497 RepID=UPI0033C94742